jgi:hypothetical protein
VNLHKAKLVNLDDVVANASNPEDVMLAIRGIQPEIEHKKT